MKLRHFAILFGLAMIVFGFVQSSFLSGQDNPSSGKPERTIWSQPAYLVRTWADRGVTQFYWYDTGPQKSDSLQAWEDAVEAAGCTYIIQTNVVTSYPQQMARKGLAGFALPDEPPMPNPIGTTQPSITPASVAAIAQQLRASCPGKLICINFDSNSFQNNVAGISAYAAALLPPGQPPLIDRVGVNWYSIEGWGIPVFPANGMPTEGQVSDKLAGLFPGIKQQMFVECSSQRLPWIPAGSQREPTPDEFSAEVAMVRARPIVSAWGLFPQACPNGGGAFQYDGISDNLLPRVVSELKR